MGGSRGGDKCSKVIYIYNLLDIIWDYLTFSGPFSQKTSQVFFPRGGYPQKWSGIGPAEGWPLLRVAEGSTQVALSRSLLDSPGSVLVGSCRQQRDAKALPSQAQGKVTQKLGIQRNTRWWFQIFFIFTPTWGRFPFWLIFFKGVETTNQNRFEMGCKFLKR